MERLLLIVLAAGKVTVELLVIDKLLKDVTIVDGKVEVALSITVPVPGVQVLPVTVMTVMAPPTVSVPPLVIIMSPAAGVAPALPIVNEPVVKAEPLENVIVPVLAVFPNPPNAL